MLAKAEDELEEYETRLEERNRRQGNLLTRSNDVIPNPKDIEIERFLRTLREKPRDIKRQLRDLVRWERDDLDWIRTLERQEREASKYRSTDTRQQQRAANWRNKPQKGQPEPEEEG